jgi:two-component system, NarL family, invasion response regulator UvrY
MTRILLVDDHEVVRRGVKQMLAEAFAPASFGEAGNLPQARELLARQPWDLVLLDVNLPGGSGLELIERARQECPTAAVLVLSAYPEEEFAVRAFKLGAAGYLTKASLADEMVAAVHKVLGGGRYVSAALAERLALALGNNTPTVPHEALSPRELEVLRQVASGRTIKEIAQQMQLSEKTVATYRRRVSDKTGLSSNVDLTRYAMQHRLLD